MKTEATENLRGLPMLDAVIDVISELPEQHDQTWWAQRPAGLALVPSDIMNESAEMICKTKRCVAGWTVVLAGGVIEWEPGDETTSFVLWKGESHDIRDLATSLLGLNDVDADELFSAYGGLAEIKEFAESWRKGEIQ